MTILHWSAGVRLHLIMHTPLTQRSWSGLTMRSRHSVGTYQGNEFTCNSSGNTQSQLSQLTKPLWTDPGLKSGIGVHKLISTWKKTHRQRLMHQKLSLKSLYARKKSLSPPPFFETYTKVSVACKTYQHLVLWCIQNSFNDKQELLRPCPLVYIHWFQ